MSLELEGWFISESRLLSKIKPVGAFFCCLSIFFVYELLWSCFKVGITFLQLESEANLRRAKQVYIARCEEYEKAKMAASRAEEEGSSSTAKAVDKKKRLEEEARNKVCLMYNTHEALMLLYETITLMR